VRIVHTEDLRPGDIHTPDHTSWIYNGLDCCVTAEVYGALIPQLDEVSRPIYARERALQGPVLDMNMAGLLVDQFELTRFRIEMGEKLDALELATNRLIREGYGTSFEWNSPAQLKWFLYDCLRLPPQYKRNTHGKMSQTVDRGALEKLSQHLIALPLLSHILLMRDLKKKLSNLNSEISPDGIFRCSFNIAGTNTGRLSSSSSDFGDGSNQQNIDRLLRRVYVARRGRKFANLDLGQADSRNVGALCWNRFRESHGEGFAGAYLDACESGDLHTAVTRMSRPHLEWPVDPGAWKKFADEPQAHLRGKSYRDTSKNWGHGSNYLLTPAEAAKKIPGATPKMAEEFRASYYTAFPCIPEWHKAVARDLRTNGHLITLGGFRRYFFDRLDAAETLRAGVAFEGQGSTADEIIAGMLALWSGGSRWPGFQLLNQTHDSVMFEYDPICESEIIPWALRTLEIPIKLAGGRTLVVPSDAKIGWNWGDYNDKLNDKDGKPRRLNLDGLKAWDPRRGDTRTRTKEPPAKGDWAS
jgi:DNA polymerase I-like protein with 3'-5' exonuclease and polymerase domains